MTYNRKDLGKQGEELVAAFIKKDGFTVLAHNYSCKSGEIDIIAQKEQLITFIEVKLRQNPYFNLSQLVTISKQKKIIATARRFIAEQGWLQNSFIYRFDIALLEALKDDYHITYIPNAFTQEYC
jgi:putative endonuclease